VKAGSNQMNRDSLEPEVGICIKRIEKALQAMYWQWMWQRSDLHHFNLSYGIETRTLKNGQMYLVLIFDLRGKKRYFPVGQAESALKALIFLQENLCDQAIYDLQKIISDLGVPFWYFKEFPPETKLPFEIETIMKLTIEIGEKIKRDSLPILSDIDRINGFLIQDYPPLNVNCKRLEAEIKLYEGQYLENDLYEALVKILPSESTMSFGVTKKQGRYLFGNFSSDMNIYYVDFKWDNANWVFRLLYFAGFPNLKNFYYPNYLCE
jgi:hypothetical protein